MFTICYFSKELKNNTWEQISGEDAMHVRVSELCGSGISSADIMVFNALDAKAHQDEQEQEDDEVKNICCIIDNSLALGGYKVMDGGTDWVVIRNSHLDEDYEIKIAVLS